MYFREMKSMEIDFPRENLSAIRRRRGIPSDKDETADVKVISK